MPDWRNFEELMIIHTLSGVNGLIPPFQENHLWQVLGTISAHRPEWGVPIVLFYCDLCAYCVCFFTFPGFEKNDTATVK